MPRTKHKHMTQDYWDRRLTSQFGLALRCEGCGKRCDSVFCRSCREDALDAIPRPDRSWNGRDVQDDVHARRDDDPDPLES